MATTAEGRGAGKGWTVLFSDPRRLWVLVVRKRSERRIDVSRPGEVVVHGHFFRIWQLFRLSALLMRISSRTGQFFNSGQPYVGGNYARIAARTGWTPMMFMARVRL